MSLFIQSSRYDRGVRSYVLGLLLATLGACDGEFRFDAEPALDSGSESDTTVSDAATSDTSTSSTTTPDTETGSGCKGDSDCPFSTLHCEPSSRTCVACYEDGQCGSGDLRRCDLTTHRCVECRVTADCESNEVCDPTTRRCRNRCGGDAGGCSGSLPVCDTTRQFCTCTEESCESGERRRCSPISHVCVECLGDLDCSSTDRKHCLDGYCVLCTKDEHCPSGKRCEPITHQCVD